MFTICSTGCLTSNFKSCPRLGFWSKCLWYTLGVENKLWMIIVGAVVVVAAGLGTGYLLSSRKSIVAGGFVSSVKEVGSTDTTTFRDSAQGTLEKGGINGEGTHKLIREGGPSQTAYLVSSIVDLDQFVGKKVEIWGETFKAQKAAWLMDVGRVRILE